MVKKNTSKKTYILDTNVLLSDSEALVSFDDNDIVLPLIVLEELDRHKDRQDEAGRNARETSRKLLELVNTSGNLRKGAPLMTPATGTLRAMSLDDLIQKENTSLRDPARCLPSEFNKESGDNIILTFCVEYQKVNPEEDITLVTRDILLRIKADILKVPCQDYRKFNATTSTSKLYTGTMDVTGEFDIDELYQKGELPPLKISVVDDLGICPNQFLKLKNEQDERVGYARFIDEKSPIICVDKIDFGKIEARNKEQEFAVDLLMDPNVKLVTMAGKAGSGKTLVALAAGLKQVLETQKKLYKSLVILRPIQPMGKDIGFLPGPQPLDAKILTPTGWTTMGEIRVGSEVISRDGKPTKVLGVFPKGMKEVYKVSTEEGSSTECCEDHLWLTHTWEENKRKYAGKVRTTKEIATSLKTAKNKLNHYLPRNEAVEFETKELPLPPYTLGVLLGDGHIGNAVSFTSKDNDIISKVQSEVLALGCKLTKSGSMQHNISRNDISEGNKPGKSVFVQNLFTGATSKYKTAMFAGEALGVHKATINDRCIRNVNIDNFKFTFGEKENKWNNPIKQICSQLGLEGSMAWTKFIPEVYLYSSTPHQRLELLRGLMDTDGTIKENGEASFTTTSIKLAQDIQELVHSLGGRAILRSRNRIGKSSLYKGRNIISKRISYEFNISMPVHLNPFHLSRKAEKHSCKYIHSNKIASIEPIGMKEVQCILVENSEHLYITDDYIVTHNTIEEKMEPWIAPIRDNLRFLISASGKKSRSVEETMNMYFEEGTIEIEAMTFIRGRSIANAFIIVDEAQNLDLHELKTILTRVGENTKIVLTGDIEQIDALNLNALNNGLTITIEKFKTHGIAGHVTLVSGERSELANLAATIL